MIRKGIIGISSLTPIHLYDDGSIVWTGTARELLDSSPDAAEIEPLIVSAIINDCFVSLDERYGVSRVQVVLGEVTL